MLNDHPMQKNLQRLHYNSHHPYSAILINFIDLYTVKIRYSFIFHKTLQLADINIPPYINEKNYINLISKFEDILKNKQIKVVHINDNFVYLYCNDTCINTEINNVILCDSINNVL